MKLCLNMIVKNEMANLPRCLASVAPYISCWVIGDTGSTDGTQDFIKTFFGERGIPGELHSFPFVNFEQARNAALDCAAASPLPYDYLLLDDADMEFVVEDADFRRKLTAPGYRLLQRSGTGFVYWNVRLVRRDAGARYHGVTHEYLDVPGGVEALHDVWYKDHASGSNRVDKFERDIRLLTAALETEPESHRYWFYLAQSYRDAGRTAEAAEAYAKRADLGGWDEEVWRARLEAARCLKTLGDEGGFLRDALKAFNQRPQRAEPLYDLAKHYRERGMNEASVLFAEAGLAVPWPKQDVLFIEDFVYTAGLRGEYSIAANYSRDPARRDRGFAICNWLALNRDVPKAQRNLARHNLRFYVEPAAKRLPSFAARLVDFTPPEGWHPTTASIALLGEEIVLVQGAVNGLPAGDGGLVAPERDPNIGRNFLLRLNGALDVDGIEEIPAPVDLAASAFLGAQGLDAMRPFAWRNALWCVAAAPDPEPGGSARQILGRIALTPGGTRRIVEWRALGPVGTGTDRMPLVVGDRLRFMTGCDPVRLLDDVGSRVAETVPAVAVDECCWGTQAIPFDGGRLVLVHELFGDPGHKGHAAHHRFVWLDETGELRGLSRPFYFQQKGPELAAGLAWHPDAKRLMISFTEGGRCWIATVDGDEVRAVLISAAGLAASPTEIPLHTAAPSGTEATPVPAAAPAIPRIFHFITGLDANFGGKPFSFVHAMAIRSALAVNEGFRAKVYCEHVPSGPYWDMVKDAVELVRVEAPREVFGNPIGHFAHKADVLRLRILLEQGGIYLDLDTICQRPFEPLLDGRVVMGREERALGDGGLEAVGLCNATIIAPPDAPFLRLWYEAYRDFSGGLTGDGWNKFSVQVPMTLAQKHPDLVRLEPASSFFWPSWDSAGIAAMFAEDRSFPEAYSFHLWESQSWPYAKDLDAATVASVDTTYNRIARRFLVAEAAGEEIQRQFTRVYQGSGVGSRPDRTVEYRAFLSQFLVRNQIRSVVDLGCGDWQFSRYLDWSGIDYLGLDVVPAVIDANNRQFSADNIRFELFQAPERLPPADLLLCKDVLQHLPNRLVKAYLAAFRGKYKYALVTNDEEPAELQNTDIEVGGWRTLRLDRAPFLEMGAVVFSWTVLWGAATTAKATFLICGDTDGAR